MKTKLLAILQPATDTHILTISSANNKCPPATLKIFSLVSAAQFKFSLFCTEVRSMMTRWMKRQLANFNIKIGHWFVVVGGVRVNSALMNLFFSKKMTLIGLTYSHIWISYEPYLQIHQTSHMYTTCFNYYFMNVTKVRYLSTVSLIQLDEIITFYSLYNYQSIFYH